MAVKKMRLDFTKVTERSGWNTAHIEEGLHLMKITEVSDAPAGDGTDMLTYSLVPVDPKFKTRKFPYFCKIQENQLFKIRDLLVAAGAAVPKKALNIDPNSPVGKIVAAEVVDGRGQYSERSEINGIYDKSVYEGDDSAPEEDDEVEDEEAEDEVDEDETEDDEEEMDEDEAELREELEALTLVALRKRAKGLGIATTGVKQDDLIELIVEEELAGDEDEDAEEDEEEDDLGEDELDEEEFDEDEDEEEEEPEPAPRRRAAAKKPAAKPAAKAAAAPAKRTVKRR